MRLPLFIKPNAFQSHRHGEAEKEAKKSKNHGDYLQLIRKHSVCGQQFYFFLKFPSGIQSPEFMVQISVASHHDLRMQEFWGAWVAQSVKRLTSAQVMISWFVGSTSTSGSVLIAQSLDPALDSVFTSFSAPPLFMLYLSLSQNK